MSYTQAVFAAFSALGILTGLAFLHFPIFAALGVFFKKTYPETEKRLRYGVVIAARDEEAVIAQLIASVRACDYPQENITVFVLAHNCRDNTARLSREAGAVVYEYDAPAEARVGYAYRELFRRIAADYGLDAFDGFLILDADNLLSPDYLLRMNEAFVAQGQEAVITSFRNAKNYRDGVLPILYGILFASACRLEARGRALCGVSTRVTGTGYLIPPKVVEDGWRYVTLTEDWELTAHWVAQGGRVCYCDAAEFFDEQPTQVPIMLRQRLRWGRGHMDAFLIRGRDLWASLPRRGQRLSKYDLALQLLPLGCIGVAAGLVQLVLLALAPLFGGDAVAALGRWGLGFVRGLAATYGSLLLSGALVLFLERKRIGRLPLLPTLLAVLLWPPFFLLAAALDVAALFVKDLSWKPIPHSCVK